MNAPSPGRLKICLLTEPLHAGVGRHVAELATGLAGRGHEVHLVYSPLRLQPEFLDMICASGVRTEAIAMQRAVGVRDFAAFRRIRRYVRAHGPFDILHGHSSKAGAHARLLKLAGSPSAVFYTPHAFVTMATTMPRAKWQAFRLVERTLAGLTDRVICTSREEQQHAVSLGIAARRTAPIFNGIASRPGPSRGELRAQLGIAEDDVVVGFVGRMDTQKAPERLLAVARRLAPEPKLAFVMIGDGPKRQALETDAVRAGLGPRIKWLGAVDGRRFMPGFDLFALVSRYEGFPYVLLEALEAGLPIVTTPVGGSLETVVPGVNGYVVPHDDVEKVASAIQELAMDSQRRAAMGGASRERAKQFPLTRMVQETERLYYETLRSTARTANDPAAVLTREPQA